MESQTIFWIGAPKTAEEIINHWNFHWDRLHSPLESWDFVACLSFMKKDEDHQFMRRGRRQMNWIPEIIRNSSSTENSQRKDEKGRRSRMILIRKFIVGGLTWALTTFNTPLPINLNRSIKFFKFLNISDLPLDHFILSRLLVPPRIRCVCGPQGGKGRNCGQTVDPPSFSSSSEPSFK